MPITGSFSAYIQDRRDNLHVLVRETAKDGAEEMQDSILHHTPRKSGKLKNSINKDKRPKRVGPLSYEMKVFTDLYYAKFVEYGTAPHIITPNKKAALEFTGVVAKEVHHPGATGAHMFQIGTAEFRTVKLELLMKKNLALYLAGGAAAFKIT